MANKQDPDVNVVLVMPTSYRTYLDTKGATIDNNRSQVVRAMIRKDMIESAKAKPKKSKGAN